MTVLTDFPSDVTTASGALTLVIPLALLAVVLVWAWTLRRQLR